MDAKQATLPARCYELFTALADSDGPNKAMDSTQAGIQILESEPDIKVGVVMVCLENMLDERFQYSFSRVYTVRTICGRLLKEPLPFSKDQIIRLLEYAYRLDPNSDTPPTVSHILDAANHFLTRNGMDEDVQAALDTLGDIMGRWPSNTPLKKLLVRIGVVSTGGAEGKVTLVSKEAWSDVAIADLHAMNDFDRKKWEHILRHCQILTSTEPSKSWLKKAQELLQALGADSYKKSVERWFPLIGKRGSQDVHPRIYQGDPNELISPQNAAILKGLVWFCSFYQDDDVARLLGNVADACFHKVTNVGARCPKVANACTATLSTMGFKEAIAQISRLKGGAKNASSRKQLEKSLGAAAQRSGMSVHDLEEISVPDFGFTEVGRFVQTFDNFQVEIKILGAGDVQTTWTDAKHKTLKAVPSAVKQNFAAELKTLKKTIVDLEKILPSIRHRIESSLLHQRHWNYKAWKERYLNHPIAGALARKLLWNFNGKAGIWLDDKIVDSQGNALGVEEMSLVELWHPIGSQTSEVVAWRRWLAERNITQPFKQAHREIYVLTDAERNTGTYSNRFAAHIIKQHQFAELAKQRGWTYTLQGQWDSHNTPTLTLPQWDLNVEFWVDPAGEEVSPAAIYMYLATDQVRFTRINGGASVPLTEIMPIVFAEVMRDVDLFVGVCSIGNDPTWIDGGRHHDYWHHFSFGDLGASAQTRKEVLQGIVPYLKIASQCSFSDKFIVVKGSMRTYKIHLGSGNILMEPNDQYLCIVPGRAGSDPGQVFLPFEGDRTLSIILSKCFMLADDSKITDTSILRQIQPGGQ